MPKKNESFSDGTSLSPIVACFVAESASAHSPPELPTRASTSMPWERLASQEGLEAIACALDAVRLCLR